MKSLLIFLLIPFCIFAEYKTHTHMGAGYSSDTNSVSSIYNQGEAYWIKNQHQLHMSGQHSFSIVDGNVVGNNSILRLAYDNKLNDTSTLFTFNNMYLNPVDTINLRNDYGIGVKNYLLKWNDFSFDLSSAPVITYTKYFDHYITEGGASFRAKINYDITENNSFSMAHFYVINTNQSFHYNYGSLAHTFNKNLGMSLDSYIAYQSNNPQPLYMLYVTVTFKTE